ILPALSVGATDAFDALDEGRSWYVVASKYLIGYFAEALTGKEVALKLHLGYGGGIYDRQVFAGTELFFAKNVTAMAEYAHGDVNVGSRFHAGRFSATVGLFDFRHVGGGIGYTVALR